MVEPSLCIVTLGTKLSEHGPLKDELHPKHTMAICGKGHIQADSQ